MIEDASSNTIFEAVDMIGRSIRRFDLSSLDQAVALVTIGDLTTAPHFFSSAFMRHPQDIMPHAFLRGLKTERLMPLLDGFVRVECYKAYAPASLCMASDKTSLEAYFNAQALRVAEGNANELAHHYVAYVNPRYASHVLDKGNYREVDVACAYGLHTLEQAADLKRKLGCLDVVPFFFRKPEARFDA